MSTKLVLVGGFLGAGKTTLLIETGRRLAARGLRVGLVTNDQGELLVDTALTTDAQIPVTEVAGGCFCCRFPDLIKALRRLQQTVEPDVILAEPVGSCTDLVATVLRPLNYYYGEQFTLAPLTVLVGSDQNPNEFSPKVRYLHEKQMAEAEWLLLSKADLLDAAPRDQRLAELRDAYPAAKVLGISTREPQPSTLDPSAASEVDSLDAWLTAILETPGALDKTLELDYATYGEAEAELGWLNLRGTASSPEPFTPHLWLEEMLDGIAHGLQRQDAPIAHMKMRAETPAGIFKASITWGSNAVVWDTPLSTRQTDRGQFVLNVRAAGSPAMLEQTVRAQLEESSRLRSLRVDLDHFECFQPAQPNPTHRIQTPMHS